MSDGDRAVDFAEARWAADGKGSGSVEARDSSGRTLVGRYDDLEGIAGISWRLVTLEASTVVSSEALSVVWPGAVVLLVGGLVAVAMAWIVTERFVAPFGKLRSAALRAATGAYVKPIEAKRKDEFGQVADAFNAVTLRLNALHDLSQLLASSSHLDQVLDGILSAMGHMVGPGVAAVYLFDDGGRWLVPVRATGVDISHTPAIDSTRDTLLASVLEKTGPSIFVDDAELLADGLPGLVADEPSALIAPLVVGRETLGVVVILRDSDIAVSDAELEMVRTFSAQAAVAVHNSRLFEFEIESRRVAEGLRLVAEQLARTEGLADALSEIESIIAGLFGAEDVSVAIVNRAALGLPHASDHDAEGEILGFSMRLLAPHGVERPIFVRHGDDPGSDALMERTGTTDLLVVPIALDTDHGAVLVIAIGPEGSSGRDTDLVDVLANEITLSLDNAYFFEQAVTRASSLETIFRISQAVGSSLDVKVVLNRVLDVVQKILSADAVALMTYDSRKRMIETEMARGDVSPTLVERAFKANDDVVGYVFASGEPVAFRDLHKGMDGIAGDAARHGLRSLLAVPLRARGRSIGVLTVFSAVEGAFSDDDMSVLQTFASQAALAIDTARLYSREHEVASILQHSILPGALPQFEGLEAASAYEPAGSYAEIGGDYYDLFRSPDGSTWLAIADVCGKGVVAATKTSMVKYAVRALVGAGFAPGRILAEVNRMVAEGGDPSDIVTLWVGRVEVDRGAITWSGGGHPAGLLRRVDGEVVRLSSGGPLLGAVSGVVYAEESIRLEVGDTILLYTDGVTEARSGNRFFGEERVETTLSSGGNPADIIENLLAAVRGFAHAGLRDDVAVLAVRLVSGESHAEQGV